MAIFDVLRPQRSPFDRDNRWITVISLTALGLSLYTNVLSFEDDKYWPSFRLLLDGLLIGSIWYLHWHRRQLVVVASTLQWLTFVLALILGTGFLQLTLASYDTPVNVDLVVTPSPALSPTPSPTPFVFRDYQPPAIEPSNDYSILLLGDSMTKALGPHMNYMSQVLNAAYPLQSFALDNYAVGSTNVLSLPDRLLKRTEIDGTLFDPILDRQIDVLVVESFAHNPLSTYAREEGLAKQREMLTQFMTIMVQQKPKTYIIFLATIAPNSDTYARDIGHLTPEESRGWADERRAYLENHIQFAGDHHIPLINVYDQSLDENRSGKLEYISNDFVHPSEVGVRFISQAISDYLLQNHILPNPEEK